MHLIFDKCFVLLNTSIFATSNHLHLKTFATVKLLFCLEIHECHFQTKMAENSVHYTHAQHTQHLTTLQLDRITLLSLS